MITWLTNPGHGGMIKGEYQTAPDKMWEYADGTIIYEGERNRKLQHFLHELMDGAGMHYINMCPTDLDLPLKIRTDFGNECHKKYKNCVWLSFHHNAGFGTGTEVFTSPGQTRSDIHATLLVEHLRPFYQSYQKKIRADWSDGDVDKEAFFWELVKTVCPAILLEVLFMDNKKDAHLIKDDLFLYKLAKRINRYQKEAELTLKK